MKTANIHTEAKITLNSNYTTDGNPIHTIEFDGEEFHEALSATAEKYSLLPDNDPRNKFFSVQ